MYLYLSLGIFIGQWYNAQFILIEEESVGIVVHVGRFDKSLAVERGACELVSILEPIWPFSKETAPKPGVIAKVAVPDTWSIVSSQS